MDEDFYVKWDKHYNALVNFFNDLFKQKMLVDCKLVAEEKVLEVHRLVLMACSPYFAKLLGDHCDEIATVVLDIKFSELQAIVNFCYNGEVSLPQNQLEGFLEAAASLKIEGFRPDGIGHKLDFIRKRSHPSNHHLGDEEEDVKRVKIDECESELDNTSVNMLSMLEVTMDDKSQPARGSTDDVSNESTNGHDEDDDDDGSDSEMDEREDMESRLKSIMTGSDRNSVLRERLEQLMAVPNGDSFDSGYDNIFHSIWSNAPYPHDLRESSSYHDSNGHSEISELQRWECHKCPKKYKNKRDLVRHLIYCGNEVARHVCTDCGLSYKYERGLQRHQKHCGHSKATYACGFCDQIFNSRFFLSIHERKCDPTCKPLPVVKLSPEVEILPVMRASQFALTVKPVKLDLLGEPQIFTCNCGKTYKYNRAFLKHREQCSTGITIS